MGNLIERTFTFYSVQTNGPESRQGLEQTGLVFCGTYRLLRSRGQVSLHLVFLPPVCLVYVAYFYRSNSIST